MIPAARRVFGLGLGLAIGLAGACFNAPQPAVHFSCEPNGASDCPEGYTCQPDGCCHLDGTTFEDHEGECQLAGGFPGTGATDPGMTGSSSGDAQTEESGGSTDPSSSGSTGSAETSSSTGDGGTTAASESGELTSSSSGTG